MACPCGISLAAPTALLVGSGLAAKFGILARGGGEAFQEMAQLDLVVFDKTGTLTEGGPRVTDVEIPSFSSWARSVILGIARELESVSTHPLANAIQEFCRNAVQQIGSHLEETPGRGVKAVFPGLQCTAILGNERWMEEHGVVLSKESLTRVENWKLEGKSIVLMAVKGEDGAAFSETAAFAITDSVRPEASSVISALHGHGIHTWLLSGDNYTTASTVATSVGIPAGNVIAGVLPQEKVSLNLEGMISVMTWTIQAQCIEKLQRDGRKRSVQSKWPWSRSKSACGRTIVAMVGDGINDAPVQFSQFGTATRSHIHSLPGIGWGRCRHRDWIWQ